MARRRSPLDVLISVDMIESSILTFSAEAMYERRDEVEMES